MKCSRCHIEAREGVTFCEECGARLQTTCPRCGAPVLPAKRFCGACGSLLTAQQPSEYLDEPSSYTPAHLAQRILTSRSALEGERKQVTVLFCDLVESSRLAERLDPEAMHEFMDRVLRLMAEAVHRYEGTVNQFLGDGLMALFGAPAAVENHAVRGAQAALAIHETLTGYGEQVKREHGFDIRLRIGLNTGLVVVGKIGDDLRMDYTAIGDTTHLASRMQMLAEPGTILVTQATRDLIDGYIRNESLGLIPVKGRSEPVHVYRLIGRRRALTRLAVSAERGLTELVGRHTELRLLQDCLARVKTGHGQVVGVVGEPGAGKSRLLYEFRRSLANDRVTWLEGQCMSYGHATPFLPIRTILAANFEVEEGDNLLQIQEKLRSGIQRLDPSLESILPYLGELFGLSDTQNAVSTLDPKERGQRTFEAIRALTLAGSKRRPQVLVFEDLHWIDKSSEDCVFKFLTESVTRAPILVLTTHRPGYTVRWADKTYYTQIALDLLSQDEAQSLMAALLRSRDLPADLVHSVWEKAEGNPLFIEEMLRSLLERGILATADGRVRWADQALVDLPATVEDIIRARIDRLADPVKRTILAASVIGREFTLRLLSTISATAAEVGDHLTLLEQVELIHETRFFPAPEYAFKHAVTQDVAYQGLLLHHRRELHGQIGEAVERLYADRLHEQAPVLAHHYSRSDHPERAIEWARLAGDRAARLYANAEATVYLQQALDIARSLPAAADVWRAEIDASLRLAAVGVTRQDVERDQKNLQRARTLADELGDESRMARVLYWLGRTYYVAWDPMRALEHARRSLEIAERFRDEEIAALAVNLIGRVSLLTSDFPKAAEMLERSFEEMRKLGNKTEEATVAGLAGTLFGFRGEFSRALPYAEHGIKVARDIKNPFAEAAAWYYRGTVRDQRGEWSLAIADYDRAVEVARAAGDRFRVYIVKCWQGRAYAMAGQPNRGRELIEESLAISQQIGTRLALSWQRTWLAACLLTLGEIDNVPALCEEAIHLADAAFDKFNNALAHRTLAEAVFRLAQSKFDVAQAAVLHAIAVQNEIGARPELARSHVTYAGLLNARGERERAGVQIAEARRMFSDMGMAWDLAQTERALAHH
jgi:class 3 adenylate cyclase/tetratricopeptide (TPR) repeat protein